VIETVDSGGPLPNQPVGHYNSIAIDSTDKVHISYYKFIAVDSSALKYATNISDSWVTETVDDTGDSGYHNSIAIDSIDRVHISYFDTTLKDLEVATNSSGSWVSETVDSTGDVGFNTSMAIDSANKGHISYYDATNFDLKYATNQSGSWVPETVDSTGFVGFGTSVALDSKDNVHISYIDATNLALKHATTEEKTWETVYNTLLDSPSDLELLRQYRDEILSNTTKGVIYKTLLYKFSKQALQVLLSNPKFMYQAKVLIEPNGDAVLDVLDGYKQRFSSSPTVMRFWMFSMVTKG
jgi:hypothetical protein